MGFTALGTAVDGEDLKGLLKKDRMYKDVENSS
jgi:hypothetical protein